MMNQEQQSDLTIAVLDELFRGRSFGDGQGFILPDGEYLNGSDLRLLFESYIATGR